jgi:hypothetical protein
MKRGATSQSSRERTGESSDERPETCSTLTRERSYSTLAVNVMRGGTFVRLSTWADPHRCPNSLKASLSIIPLGFPWISLKASCYKAKFPDSGEVPEWPNGAAC